MDDKERLEEIKNNLSLEEIENLLSELGGEPHRQGNIIIAKTICHCGESHKLFYYDNTKLFRCYTECSEIFDVFQLVMKVKATTGVNIALPQALQYVINFFNLETFFIDNTIETKLEDWQVLNRYDKSKNIKENKQIVELKVFDKSILNNLPHPRILPWEKENMTKEVIKYHNICYNPISQGIVIPHYDIKNDLIGIRERTLIKENEEYGKYRPSILNKKMYNHPLGFNLYNINNSKDNIKKIKKAIIFESEKSCLLYASYFGIDNNISVAVCGSSLGTYQMSLLLNLGVEEVVIAFDKQFKELGDEEWKGWTKKLTDIYKKYGSMVKISYMFDKWDLLGYKDSPIDNGKEKFLELFKRRLTI